MRIGRLVAIVWGSIKAQPGSQGMPAWNDLGVGWRRDVIREARRRMRRRQVCPCCGKKW